VPLSSHNGTLRSLVATAHAVDGYLLDEQLINVGDVFIVTVSVVADHFMKTFPPRGYRYFHVKHARLRARR